MPWIYILVPPLVGVGYLIASAQSQDLLPDWSISKSIASCAIVLLMIAGIWYKSLVVIVTQEAIEVRSCFRRRMMRVRDIQRIDVICTSGRGATRTLNVFDTDAKRFLSVYDSLQDFDGLVGLLKFNCHEYGVLVRQRDSFGTWSTV
ncbi:MAG TPA: hypothetical protein VEH00_00915 [Steroidobacteraceae bacterium]|nr:hypothetical protein [Steroidobacteraceae bacterium]